MRLRIREGLVHHIIGREAARKFEPFVSKGGIISIHTTTTTAEIGEAVADSTVRGTLQLIEHFRNPYS